MKVEIKTKREESGLEIDLKNVYLTNDLGIEINLDFYLKELLKRLKDLESKTLFGPNMANGRLVYTMGGNDYVEARVKTKSGTWEQHFVRIFYGKPEQA